MQWLNTWKVSQGRIERLLVGQRQRVFESVQAVRELFVSLCDGFFLASVAFVQKVRDVTEFTSQVFLTST